MVSAVLLLLSLLSSILLPILLSILRIMANGDAKSFRRSLKLDSKFNRIWETASHGK